MSTPEDRELDALLSRSGRVHAAWREASVEEPPGALDEAIRAAARRAVRAGPRPAGGSFVSRWRVPMSIAAVLVVSATLTLLLSDRGEHLPGADLRQAPTTSEAPSEADATTRDATKAADGDERLRTAPNVAEVAPAKKQASPPTVDVNEPVAEQREAIAPGGGQLAKESAPRQPEPFPAPSDAKAAQQEPKLARQQTEQVQGDGAPAARRDAQEPAAPQPESVAALEARAKAQTQAEALADRAEPPTSPAVAARVPAEESKATANQAVRAPPAAAGTSEVASHGASTTEVESAPARRELSATTKREAQPAAIAPALEPKAWVERMLALQRDGKVREAQRSLEEFRRRYPDYPLPPELAVLLKPPVSD